MHTLEGGAAHEGGAPGGAPPRWHFAWRLVVFGACFALQQWGWEAARGTALERLWVDGLTVQAGAALIHVLTPNVGALAQGTRIVAPGGGLNVMFGCEGTDVLFLLVAAFIAFPMSARTRLTGLLATLPCVFVLNQLRIVALFYAFRHDRALFELLHGTAAPLVLVCLAGLFFHAWWQRGERTAAAPAA